MSGVADGQLAFERQVAAFLGSMAEEIPAGRYSAPRTMIARAHARVAATIVGAVLLLAAIGVGGAIIVHALQTAVGSAASAANLNGAQGSAGTRTNGRLGSAANPIGQGLWGAGQSRSYLGASAPGQYSAGLPGDIGPGRPWLTPGRGWDQSTDGSRPYGRPHGEGLGGFGGGDGGQSGNSPPIFGGGFEPPAGALVGSVPNAGTASVDVHGPADPATAATPKAHGRTDGTGGGRHRDRDRD